MPTAIVCTMVGVEQQAAVWQAIAEAAGQSTTPDGRCRTENEVLLAVGRR